MLKTVKQLKVTFTSVSLLVLLCVSLILFLAQFALAQTEVAPRVLETVPREMRSAQQVERQQDAETRREEAETRRAAWREALDARRAAALAQRDAFVAAHASRTEMLAEKRAEIETRRAEQVAALEARAQERIDQLADTAAARLQIVIDKLADITDRVRERALELDASGTNVDEVLATLNSVDILLADATDALTTIDVSVEYTITSPDPRTDWADARQQFIAIRDLLNEARVLLRDAVAALKTAGRNDDTEAEPSEEQAEEEAN